MQDRATWMYDLLRYSQAYVDEVDKFIIAAVNHVKTLSGTNCSVICPRKDCKNHMTDYTVWIHHGEVMVVDDNNDDQEDDVKAQQYQS